VKSSYPPSAFDHAHRARRRCRPAAAIPGLLGVREVDDLLLLIDGIPAGGAFIPQIEAITLNNVERIEVLRGAAPHRAIPWSMHRSAIGSSVLPSRSSDRISAVGVTRSS
jgi:hypothetical protein